MNQLTYPFLSQFKRAIPDLGPLLHMRSRVAWPALRQRFQQKHEGVTHRAPRIDQGAAYSEATLLDRVFLSPCCLELRMVKKTLHILSAQQIGGDPCLP
ncbi:MAG: hypothetical protein MRJ68_18185 [Nitrospira sp.]|nr:hypothetical protein [Nitrospira sp.]